MTKAEIAKPYASVRASAHNGYGHLHISVYGLWPTLVTVPSFAIRCQVGGESIRRTYAWKYGISQSIDPLGCAQLQAGLTVVRRVDKGLQALRDKDQYPANYQEYVVAILQTLRARKMHYLEGVNTSMSGDHEDLPFIDCFSSPHEARDKLHYMLETLYDRC